MKNCESVWYRYVLGIQGSELPNRSLPRIAVLNLEGNVALEGPLNMRNCREAIDEAFRDTETVLLNINSFGGSGAQPNLLNMYINEKSARQ